MAVAKSLDQKLAILAKDRYHKSFILADAKDADMAFGIASPGKSPEMHAHEGKHRTLSQYRQQIRDIVQQGLVDIMLMSASTSDVLTIGEKLFAKSHITPAARANDTTDIHIVRGGTYAQVPSRPFSSASIDHIQCGKVACEGDERFLGANLGLYSCTFNNIPERDLETLTAYKNFRHEAERKGFKHFLEVFDPNVDSKIPPEQFGAFINDHIVRTLAGVPRSGRPLFLKIAYHGPKYMEELCRYDESLIVGILGGSSGTTMDAFHMLAEAKGAGARVALYGRKINNSEHQLSFVKALRLVADDQITPAEAVKLYHSDLQKLNIKPYRAIDQDMLLTSTANNYGATGTGAVISGTKPTAPATTTAPVATKPASNAAPATAASSKPKSSVLPRPAGIYPLKADGTPDFAKMTALQKQAYQKARRDAIYGK